MTRNQFETILKIIELGAPVLYNELGGALNTLVIEKNKLEERVKELENQVKEDKTSKKASETK